MNIKPVEQCRWDEVSLGEIMLRLDPGDTRVRTARSFRVWEGGGEYNVARGLRKCFGLRTAVVTAIPENEGGRLLEDLILQGGVATDYIQWVPYDGIGENVRVGLNFTERGFGVRGAVGTSDRARSAAAAMKPEDIDWKGLFADQGVRWFHCGGIFAALSGSAPEVILAAMEAARDAGTIISYDLNYRPSLWKRLGGQEAAQKINRHIATYVDVMIGNEEDFTACLGYEVEGVDDNLTALEHAGFKRMIERVTADYPNLSAVATTLRGVHTATVNDWAAILWSEGAFHVSSQRERLEIYDRVGGGDSFASGLIYGFLTGLEPSEALEYGAAHGALAMTTPGDTSMASLVEVKRMVAGAGARVIR